MKEAVFLKAVRTHIAKTYDSQASAAKKWGITPQRLCMILAAGRPPTKEMLDELGYDREVETTVSYKKRGKDD